MHRRRSQSKDFVFLWRFELILKSTLGGGGWVHWHKLFILRCIWLVLMTNGASEGKKQHYKFHLTPKEQQCSECRTLCFDSAVKPRQMPVTNPPWRSASESRVWHDNRAGLTLNCGVDEIWHVFSLSSRVISGHVSLPVPCPTWTTLHSRVHPQERRTCLALSPNYT